jgi:hypothetical protein
MARSTVLKENKGDANAKQNAQTVQRILPLEPFRHSLLFHELGQDHESFSSKDSKQNAGLSRDKDPIVAN